MQFPTFETGCYCGTFDGVALSPDLLGTALLFFVIFGENDPVITKVNNAAMPKVTLHCLQLLERGGGRLTSQSNSVSPSSQRKHMRHPHKVNTKLLLGPHFFDVLPCTIFFSFFSSYWHQSPLILLTFGIGK